MRKRIRARLVVNLGRGTRGNGNGMRNVVFFWGGSLRLSRSVKLHPAEKRKREDILLAIVWRGEKKRNADSFKEEEERRREREEKRSVRVGLIITVKKE